ncbi:MAG: hypothetical protein LKI39_12970 [Bacteroides sp.]|jgi:pilus assembly protein Flp/PilA|nr:hypothetical protein [Bacteroides sp.]MCI1683447.1 hypothetical protein [Bacteroides sp.]
MKKFILFLALCSAVTNFFGQNADPSQLMKDGNNALNAKNYQVAFTKYSKYLTQTNFQDSVTAYNCGVCADKIKKPAEAAKYFDVAIQKKYNLANAYIGKASALRDLKKDDDYIATLKEGMAAVSNNSTLEKLYAIYYLKKGISEQKAGKIEGAEENYNKVLDVSSKKWKTDALYSLGVLFYNHGANTLKAAIPLASSDQTKYTAEKEKANADFKKAKDYLEQALQLSPNRAAAKTILTQVEDQMKK